MKRDQSYYTRLNLRLPAGAPMAFACAGCSGPIWVPECYVAKPTHCPGCGGPFSARIRIQPKED